MKASGKQILSRYTVQFYQLASSCLSQIPPEQILPVLQWFSWSGQKTAWNFKIVLTEMMGLWSKPWTKALGAKVWFQASCRTLHDSLRERLSVFSAAILWNSAEWRNPLHEVQLSMQQTGRSGTVRNQLRREWLRQPQCKYGGEKRILSKPGPGFGFQDMSVLRIPVW